ncbi:MAG: nickel pincer cofactor biosynthesis protein LarC [Tissierellales bacterium]|nr:nickel pincer cofactor biosynthesis protein LarC [Tissierellales bacterium]
MANKALYFECNSGISGDMTVAALLDLGLDQEKLLYYLNSLKIEGFKINIEKVLKNSISALKFDVILNSEDNIYKTNNIKEIKPGYSVKLKAAKKKHNHNHEHRNLNDINKIIDDSMLSDNAKKIAKGIFEIIAKAEAKAHNLDIYEVHFHEVGAVDSIVDIAATAILIDELGIKEIYFSPISEGKGIVKIQHGILPVPVPAVANIFAQNDLIMNLTDEEGEMITPTGAGIAAFLNSKNKMPHKFRIKRIGLGAGSKDFSRANILRIFEIEIEESDYYDEDDVILLETNIDDITSENLGFVFERLLENGANDVFFTPIYMKKNRPSYMLSVISKNIYKDKLEEIIFINTTSLGIREQKIKRKMLEREIVKVNTKYGEMTAKKINLENGSFRIQPEYEEVKKICIKNNLSFYEVYNEILCEINRH